MSIPLPQQAQLRLLGPVLLESATGSTSTPPGPRAKSLVIALALAPGRTLSPEQLIDDVWGLDAPASSKTALHTLISRTRSFAPELLASSAGGYRLTAPRSSVDLWQAEQLQHEALKYLDEEPGKAAELASSALELWTGDPASDASPSPAVEELRRQALRLQTELSELYGRALLSAGQPVAAIEVLRPLAEAEPLSEQRNLLLIRALHAAGRTSEALSRFEVFRRALRNELGSSPSPAAATLQATLLTADSPESSEAKAAAEPKPRRQFLSGLRAAPNELLGRESDIAGLEQVMTTSRVTTVLGPGGLGKTRLAMEIAQRQADSGLPSVIVVELASVRDGEDIWLALASALGITEPRQKPTSLPVDIRRRIVETLLERRTLLFMDNCEHVIEAAAAVIAELIASVPRLNVLTTSRAPLEIAGERVYPLQALATEASDGTPAAISLFLERATAARPSAALPADTVAALCARLDGLPLAIELAAARVRTMNVEEILSRISERFSMMTVLRGTDRTAPERHRTLHAVIDWSWSLLGESEQAALRRLCSFPSGFSLEAAIALAGSDRDLPGSVEDDIEILLNQSLLRVYENQQSSHLRYRMLETVREFGAIEQDRAGEVTLVATQMADWARSWCTVRIGSSYGPSQLKTVHEVTVEQDNLIFILRRAIVERDTKTVFPLFALLGNYWSIRSMHQDVVSFADAVMESIGGVPVEDEDVPAALLAVTIISATTAMVNLRLSAKARTMVRRLLARNIPLDEHLRTMSELWLCLGSPEKLAAQVAQAKSSQHKMTHSTAFLVESFLMENSGRISEAISAAQTAFRLGKELDDGWTMGTVSVSLAQLFTQRANHAQALIWGERAIGYLSELDAVSDLRQLQALIAANHISLGQLEAAEHIFAAELANLDDDQFFDSPGIGIAVQAEIYLHSARVEAGLAAYRTLLDSKIYQALPTGPYGPVLVAAAICAHLLNDVENGKTVSVRQQTLDYWCKHLRLRTIAWRRMSGQSFTDRPVLGTSAMTIGSWAVLTAPPGSPRSSVGLELLTMSDGRQDVPSLLWERHLAAARSRLGDAAVETQLRLAPDFSSDASLQRVFELLSDPALRD